MAFGGSGVANAEVKGRMEGGKRRKPRHKEAEFDRIEIVVVTKGALVLLLQAICWVWERFQIHNLQHVQNEDMYFEKLHIRY